MGGEAVSQGMRVDVLVRQPGTTGSLMTGMPDAVGGDGMLAGVPAPARKQPDGRLATKTAPVQAQSVQQLGAEHDIAILASLTAADMNHHSLAVDIADLQPRDFGAA